MSSEKLRLMLDIFEAKLDELEEHYKREHKENFNENKMKKYINRKLKMEIQILNYCNIMPSVKILKNSESFI